MFLSWVKVALCGAKPVWPDFGDFHHFGDFWRILATFFCPILPVYKSFDVDILVFKKLGYLLCRQIWRFSPKYGRFFGLNTWSHCIEPLAIFCSSISGDEREKLNIKMHTGKQLELLVLDPNDGRTLTSIGFQVSAVSSLWLMTSHKKVHPF